MGTERSAWLMYFFPPQIVAIHNVQFGASGGVVICPRSSILVLSNSIPPRRLKGRSDNWARPHHSVAPFGELASGIFGVPLCCIHPAAPSGIPSECLPERFLPPQWVVIHSLIRIAVRVYRKGFLGDRLG